MVKSTDLRTGIDLGSTSVKLVRGQGKHCLEEVSIVASESIAESTNKLSELERERLTVAALKRILDRHDLSRRNMGRICVSIRGGGASIREVVMPPLTDKDLQMALPFEAKTHLDIEAMDRPVFGAQVLGDSKTLVQDGVTLKRVLLVAVPSHDKNFPLRVLKRVGVVPEVLDVGATQSSIHFSGQNGGVLSRRLGKGIPPKLAGVEAFSEFLAALKLKISETLYFYRQRFELEVAELYLAGGGANLEGLQEELQSAIRIPVLIENPLKNVVLAKSPDKIEVENASEFVTAFGLCRWGDAVNV